MYPLVGFASQAKGYVKKERRFLSDAPLCRLSEKIPGCKKCPQSDFLVSEKEVFGGCHLQLLQAAARCEQACFGGRVHGQDPCLHTLSKHCLSDVPPDRFSLAMYPLGGFAGAPLSSYLSDDFLLISLPRGLKTLVDAPFLSFGCDFLEES